MAVVPARPVRRRFALVALAVLLVAFGTAHAVSTGVAQGFSPAFAGLKACATSGLCTLEAHANGLKAARSDSAGVPNELEREGFCRAPAAAESRRVISIIPATTEMLFAMGAGDRLVAVGSYDRFPPQVEKLPRVGALLDPDVERILSMRPDLVILYGTQTELRTQLDRAGIPYYSYTHHGLADITETIRSLGARVGAAAKADALATQIEHQLTGIRAHVAKSPRPRTLLVFGREKGTLTGVDASGGEGFLHDMLETAGGTDVLGDLKRQSVMMSTEMLLSRAPDVIIELRYGRGDSTADADMRDWNTLASVPAVRNHRVYLLRGEEFVVPGPRVAAATERIARTLHPEAFK